ncbi:ABC transporter permease [Flavivirga algicola]|uniref:FtsX-like permease family protein n=1 Tax=Flavivirga algicola TaxID=2729136 RepID=A0ABX1S0Z1_9FLAO|nr:ABC transporter permease [Flavivirga algicola]NMH88910.1 FtsX-like permease family protein [Flavivirga algicola]
MIRNYFKIAWRSFSKDKSFTAINLLGLATGFAIALLIIQYVRFELSYENTHENADRIVRLTYDIMDGETVSSQDCETNPPLGAKLQAEMNEIKNFTRAYHIGEPTITIEVNNKQFIVEKVYATDPSFFNLFSYPLIHGKEEGLFKEPNQTVLTESVALKYFNRTNVIGETIALPAAGTELLLDIVGVVPDSPSNTHLKFDMLMSYTTLLKDPIMQAFYGETENNWDGNNTYTYALLNDNASYENFTQNLVAFNKQLKREGKLETDRVISQKIEDIHLYSNKPFEPEPNGSATAVFFLLGVAFLVIISAYVNYINLTTSKALDRAKEVGVRKVVGSTKSQLRFQFLVEAFLMNLLAGVCALIIIFFVKDNFVEIAGLPDGFNVFTDIVFWGILGVFLVFGVLFSGVYPALVLSSFKPSLILKGNFTHSFKGVLLRKSLVVFQFTVTIVLLILVFTIKSQLSFIRNIELGVETENTIVVEAPMQNGSTEKYSVFKQKLLANSNIKNVSLSEAVPGELANEMSTTTGINLSESSEKHNHNFYITTIDKNFIPLMNMQLLAGTNFDKTSTPNKQEVIVNEKALKLWGVTDYESVIGKTIKMWGAEWSIKGVLKDYHQESAKAPFVPIIHRFSNSFDGLASIKFHNSNPKKQLAQLAKVYKSVFPEAPFSYFFMDTEFDKQFKADRRFQSVFNVLTGFAILIACLGLFGLASFTVLKRQKEIGIRKVIGASVSNILVLLSKNFVKTVFISMLIGVPIAYLLANNWLDNFASRISLSLWMLALPVILVFLLVIISISIKTINAALINPVHSLKQE